MLEKVEMIGEKKQPLITIERGTVDIKEISFSPKFSMDIRLRFKNATLYRDYYKKTAAEAGFWGSLMRKPIVIKDLCARTTLEARQTFIQITGCDSDHVEIRGDLGFSAEGALHNRIETLFTPYRVLRAIF